ncbi:MAG TPA: hypothetical protein VJ623_10665 [Holophagaceae bacterium]|nr:hypothetical protein [Holophagaceae bacterium]
MRESEQNLQWALQALAQPAHLQPRLFPDVEVATDELILEFSEAFRRANADGETDWSESQRHALRLLNREIEALTASDHPEIWEDNDCLTHPAWANVRQLAAGALAAFHWLNQAPPIRRGQ